MQGRDRIICALDVDNAYRAIQLVGLLRDHVGVFKVGLELINSAGIEIVDRLHEAGAERIFYDAKLHDIPNTVAGAMRGIARLDVWCVTAHTTGGSAMLRAAVDGAHAAGGDPPKILGVTVLTSISAEALRTEIGVETPLHAYVPALAKLAHAAGCAGVIASPLEVSGVRAAVKDPGFLVITPGVRPAGADRADQARTMTPSQAVICGARYVVVGRPIVGAQDPVEAARAVAAEIDSAG